MTQKIKATDVFSLLQQTTSIAIVSEYLKSKGLHHSASSWEKLYQDRISPYIQRGELLVDDLVQLLRSVEEYGKQHVFLYKCTEAKAKELINESRLKGLLQEKGLGDLLDHPKVLDQPPSPTIVDVRIEKSTLVIKIVEQRVFQKFVEEKPTGNNRFVREYELVKERAVNIFNLSGSGLLEIRIASHSNSSHYFQELARLQKLVADFIPITDFKILSLANAKIKIWNDRDTLKKVIRYSDITFRNELGTLLRAVSGAEDDDLFEDEGAVSGINEFVSHDGYCDKSNIWFLASDENALSKDIHVLLLGEANEFAITANCTNLEYKYVFDQLRQLNS